MNPSGMRAGAWRCGECGAVLPDSVDVEAHFRSHPVPFEAALTVKCAHPPLFVDVTPQRIYLWSNAAELADPELDLDAGWTRKRAPPVVREIIERENHADLDTPGWYYPHTRSSAAALDALYHERMRQAENAPRPPRTAPDWWRPTEGGMYREYRRSLLDANPKRRARLIAAVEIASGIVVGVVGSNLLYLCTSYIPFDGCGERGYGLPGFVLLLAGSCLALYGLASLVVTFGKELTELPKDWRPGATPVDPKVQAGVERTASILWAAILMAILVAAEAFPVYGLVQLTSAGPNPTFDLGPFLVDMAFFGIADAIVVFFIVTYGSNN